MGMEANAALSSLGKWSRWQIMFYIILNITLCLPASMHMMAIVFVGMDPEYHCTLPEGLEKNETIPTDEKGNSKQCEVYTNFTSQSNTTQDCPMGITYVEPVYSIVNEWELVCDRSYLVSTSQTVLVAGVMLGAMLTGMISDKFGRKSTFLGSVVAISVVGLITAAVENYVAFVILRFITGVFQQGVTLVGYIMTCELFPASERTVAGIVMQCFWALGMFLLALLGYLLPYWRHLMVAVSLTGLPAIPLFWLLPESIPWLVAKHRYAEAKQIIEKAAKFNKVKLPTEFQLTEEEKKALDGDKKKMSFNIREYIPSICGKKEDLNTPQEKPQILDAESNYTIMDVFRSKRLLIFAMIMCYIWCVNALVYYGLSLSTGSLAGNPYLNFFFSGLVEVPAYLLAAALLQLVGRRWPLCILHIIAGVPLFLTIFIPETTASGTNLVPLIVTCSMIGKFGITATFGSIFLYAPELFPTTVRNVGLGIASVGARIGNIASPSAPLLAKYVPWLPNIIFGTMAIGAGVLTLLLPETLNRALPQTIEEVENWPRTISKEEKQKLKNLKKAQQNELEMQKKSSEDPVNDSNETDALKNGDPEK